MNANLKHFINSIFENDLISKKVFIYIFSYEIVFISVISFFIGHSHFAFPFLLL